MPSSSDAPPECGSCLSMTLMSESSSARCRQCRRDASGDLDWPVVELRTVLISVSAKSPRPEERIAGALCQVEYARFCDGRARLLGDLNEFWYISTDVVYLCS